MVVLAHELGSPGLKTAFLSSVPYSELGRRDINSSHFDSVSDSLHFSILEYPKKYSQLSGRRERALLLCQKHRGQGWGWRSMVEHLPRICKALDSIPSSEGNKRRKKCYLWLLTLVCGGILGNLFSLA